MDLFIQQVVNGIALGSIYSLVALGFTLVYGMLFFINLPHGDILVAGTYIALFLLLAGVPILVALPLSMVATAILGIIIERVAYRRLRYSRRLAPLLSALGVSLILSNAALVIGGPASRSFPSLFGSEVLEVFGLFFPPVTLVILAGCAALVIGLQLFFARTVTGLSIRAVSQDIDAARLMGININRAVSITFGIGSALAAAGGVFLAMRFASVNPFFGFSIMLKAFAACVLGGIGNIFGALVGAMAIGVAEALVAGYISTSFRDAVAFTILIVVILVKPDGLLGGRVETRL